MFVRLCGMTHVRTSPHYPQSNGKIEAWHKTLKVTTLRPQPPESVEKVRELVERFVGRYNNKRLHGAIGCIAPADKLAGRESQLWADRDAKLAHAREHRASLRENPLWVGKTGGQWAFQLRGKPLARLRYFRSGFLDPCPTTAPPPCAIGRDE
jgi:hypothetical protein